MPRIVPIADHRSSRPLAAADAFAPGAPVVDTLGRRLHDLRISVTDRCNFRCVYCMPRDVFGRDYPFLPHDALLTFEEIARVAGVFAGLGVEKIRLTGGEPLLRKHLEKLVAMLAPLPVDLTLTTNGALLARKAQALADAGLKRVTVSLDAIDDATFRAMGDTDTPVATVLDGIDAAARAGTRADQGQRGDQARRQRACDRRPRAPFPRQRPHRALHRIHGRRRDQRLAHGRRRARVRDPRAASTALPDRAGRRELRRRGRRALALPRRLGRSGRHRSVTRAFCRDCTRLRLSTDGKLYTCLFATQGHDLAPLVRGGADDDALMRAIGGVWRQRGDRYSELRTAATAPARKVEMSYIGG
jgi:cyclic pyranopterin phosphate synthase